MISETKLDTFKIPLEKSSHVSFKVVEAVSQLIRDFSWEILSLTVYD